VAYELKDKVILITGGASGLGEAIAIKAAAQGARIAIVDRNAEAAEALCQRIDGARGYAAEVGSLEEMERTCRKVAQDFGGLNGAVNNAGIPGDWASVVECSSENWDRVIEVNLTGVFNSLKAELPHILDAGGGSIVNMASVAGLLAQPRAVAYIAAKHGVVGLTKSTAVDFGRRGVRCNAVCPSYVRTPMTETLDEVAFQQMAQNHPIGRLVTAEEVADVAIFLLGPRSAGITGSVHLVDGGIAAEFKA
jgi:NAD(P)-dependent dehydrogenase (short-subunit alcohol dehydrogenase family)